LLSWSTALERATYAVTLMSVSLSMSAIETVDKVLKYDQKFVDLKIPFIAVGLVFLVLYRYIYITKNRYSLLIAKRRRETAQSKAKSIRISIAIIAVSVMSPFILGFIFSL
jgi:preprotein translocase subunit SecY